MHPLQVLQDTPHRNLTKDGEAMSPGSGRKKPICQKCGFPMAGHKRPYGMPICPNDASPEPQQKRSPSLVPSTLDGPGPSAARKLMSPDFQINPSASGYWHRSNPYFNNETYGLQGNPLDSVPRRGEIAGSWISTEPAETSRGSPVHKRGFPSPLTQPPPAEVIEVDEEDEGELEETHELGHDDTSDTQSNVSHSSSDTILHRVGRRLSLVIGRSTPIASLYSSPRDEVAAITSAAEAEGLYTRVMHRPRENVKSEPTTPPRTLPTREYSWWVAFGRDRTAVNALADSHTPRRPRASGVSTSLPPDAFDEPYDYDRGLSSERDERVGSYPVDPRSLRNSPLDIMAAGMFGGLVMFYCLSIL